MKVSEINNNINSVNIGGKIAKIYLDKDLNDKEYYKIIIENCRIVKDKEVITSVRCYFYNQCCDLIKNNKYERGDYIKVSGELQNRDNLLVVFVKDIIKK